MNEASNIWRFVKRMLVRIFLYPVILLIVAVLYLSTFGFPPWLIRELQGRIPTGDFMIEAEVVKIDVIRGVVLEQVKLYRKRVVGPAALEADRIVIGIDPLAVASAGKRVQYVSIVRGAFRPAMLLAKEKASKESASAPMDVRVELDHCTVYGVEIEKLSMRLHADPAGVRCEDMEGILRSENWAGPFKGRVGYDTRVRACEGQVETHFDLHVLTSVLEAWDMPFAIRLVNRFDFGASPPRCEANFRRSFAADNSFRLNATFGFGNATYRDVNVLRADGQVSMNFSPTNTVVTVDPLLLVRSDGTARGRFTVDGRKQIVEFEGESTIPPKPLIRMIGIFPGEVMDPWRFEGPVSMVAKGCSSYNSYSNVDFEVTFEGRNTGVGEFLAQDCAFTMRMFGETNTVSDLRGKLYGGEFLGSAVLVVPPWGSTNDIAYSIDAKLKDADFEKVMKSLTREKREYSGQLSGRARLQGWLGKANIDKTTGQAAVKIRDGKVYMMPVFGGLSTAMAKIVPGLDFVLRQSDATAELEIGNGKIHTDKVLVEGDVLSLNGHGDYFLDGRLDFNAQVKLMKEHTFVAKIVGLITYPLSKLFEFRVRGTLAQPRWYPVNFSRDLLEKLGLDKEKEEP